MKAPERRRTNKNIFSRILPPGPVLICICILKLIPFNLFLICGDARSCLVKKYETIIKCTDNSSSEDNYRVMLTRVEFVWFTNEYTSNIKKIAVKPGLNVLFLLSRRQWSLSFISFLHKSLFLVIMWAVVRFKKVSAWYRFKNTLTAVIASLACLMASLQSDQSSPKWTLNHHLCWNHWSGLLRTWMEQPGVVVAAV